jgi:uncharacterized membrane protein (DUF4010 family)
MPSDARWSTATGARAESPRRNLPATSFATPVAGSPIVTLTGADAVPLLGVAVALGIGLLIGAERERRKGEGPRRAQAGLRTFALTALAGACAMVLGDAVLLAVVTAGVAAFAAIGYLRSRTRDPGVTTETAMVVTVLLGGLAVRDAAAASAIGVCVAILLAARDRLHGFVKRVLSGQELEDGLVLGAAALVVMPFLPDRGMGPFDALNPHTLWLIVVLVMAIGSASHVATRALGARYGLPLAGFVSGFVSSAATVGAMAARAVRDPAAARSAAAAAVLSTVATVVQLTAVLAVTSAAVLAVLWPSLVGAGLAAVLWGAVYTRLGLRSPAEVEPDEGRAFSIRAALGFAAIVAVTLVTSAALRAWAGTAGLVVASGLAGFADTHAAAVSVASLVREGRLDATDSAVPVLAAFTTNAVMKSVLAIFYGNRRFALQVVPGVALTVVGAWLAYLVAR